MNDTELTRPFISSGVASWINEERINMEIISAAPAIISAAMDSQKSLETANTKMPRPNTTTDPNIQRPTFRDSGFEASK